MIIPVRCMNCNKVIADKWRFYQAELAKLHANDKEHPVFIEGKEGEKITTPEGELLRKLGLTRPCCFIHFITHRDLMDKI